MTRKFEALTVKISDAEKRKLEEIALFFDCKWGDGPNISKLLKEIAAGNITLVKNKETIKFSDRKEFEEKIQAIKLLAQELERF